MNVFQVVCGSNLKSTCLPGANLLFVTPPLTLPVLSGSPQDCIPLGVLNLINDPPTTTKIPPYCVCCDYTKCLRETDFLKMIINWSNLCQSSTVEEAGLTDMNFTNKSNSDLCVIMTTDMLCNQKHTSLCNMANSYYSLFCVLNFVCGPLDVWKLLYTSLV